MRRSCKSMVGVTLLEIMLVLAIAAMVIVMSIRYYQSASLNQKINSSLSNVIAVVGAAESYLSSNGSFTSINNAAIQGYFPSNKVPNAAWGNTMTVASTVATQYTITFDPAIPAEACPAMQRLVGQNSKLVMSSCTLITVSA